MKKYAQPLFVALLLSTAAFASTAATLPAPAINSTATRSYKVAVFPSTVAPAKISVILEHQPGKAVYVNLLDARGTVLATQYIGKKQDKVHFKFDLNQLEDGNYRIEVVSGTDRSVHPVTLSTETPAQSIRLITMN